MKVILLSDVKKVGKKGQVLEVSDGYASNYLIPNKLAVKATKTSINIKQKQDDDYALKQEELKQEAIILKDKLEGLTLEMKAKTGKDGKMFGAISTKQIVDEYKNQFDIELDKRKFLEAHSIVSLGYTKLKIELYKGVIATIIVHVSEF
jgi:large subunit ribosomal protein L9